MALSRVKTWVTNEVLTSSDLNAEFNNILNNSNSLFSPWTANVDAGGFRLITLSAGSVSNPTIQPTGDTNTGIYFSAADILDVAAGGVRVANFSGVASAVNYLELLPSVASSNVILRAAGTDSNIGISITPKGTGGIQVSSTAPTTAVANTLYGTNIVKGWAFINYSGSTPSIADGFNAVSVAANATGDFTVTWGADMANTSYVPLATAVDGHYASVVSIAVGTTRFKVRTDAGTAADSQCYVMVIGDQA